MSATARAAYVAVVVLLLVFVGALALAARSYPGGNWDDVRAVGHDLWRNYWCDLMREHAVNDADNAASAAWGKLAFVALGLALLPFWWLAGSLLRRARERRAVVWLGTLGAVCVLGVPVFTYDDYREAHAICTILAGALCLAATLLVVVGAARRDVPGRARHVWGALLGALMLANLALYVPLVLEGGGHDAWLPVVQKLGTVAALGWMLSTARAALQGGDTPRDDTSDCMPA